MTTSITFENSTITHHEVAHVLARDAVGGRHEAHGLRWQESRAKATRTRSPLSQPISRLSEHQRVLRASTAMRPSCRRSSPPAWRCLLAEPALQLTDMVMGRTQLGGRNHLLAGAAGGQRALRHQPAPGEELVAS